MNAITEMTDFEKELLTGERVRVTTTGGNFHGRIRAFRDTGVVLSPDHDVNVHAIFADHIVAVTFSEETA